MVEAFDKFVKRMIDDREYSPGLVVKIVDTIITEKRDFPSLTYKITLNNEGNVPFEYYVILENLKHQIDELKKYMPFDDKNIEPEVQLEYVEDFIPGWEYFYITNEFKQKIYEELVKTTSITGDREKVIDGKFLPRIDFKENIVKFHFSVKSKTKKEKSELEEEINEMLSFSPNYKFLMDAFNYARSFWPRNFQFDEEGLWVDYESDYLNFEIKIV